MIPCTDHALRMLSQRLLTQILPGLTTIYAQSEGALTGLLMNAIADEIAEGIERRLQDIREMADLLTAAGLGAEVARDPGKEVASFALADVNARHDELTRLLIRVHEQVELTPELAKLQGLIWDYLGRTVERHAITAVP